VLPQRVIGFHPLELSFRCACPCGYDENRGWDWVWELCSNHTHVKHTYSLTHPISLSLSHTHTHTNHTNTLTHTGRKEPSEVPDSRRRTLTEYRQGGEGESGGRLEGSVGGERTEARQAQQERPHLHSRSFVKHTRLSIIISLSLGHSRLGSTHILHNSLLFYTTSLEHLFLWSTLSSNRDARPRDTLYVHLEENSDHLEKKI